MRLKSILRPSGPVLAAGLLPALVLAGCGQDPEAGERNGAFRTTWDLAGEGRAVTLSGDSFGHRAGNRSSFELALDNRSEDAWKDEYCVLLVDTNGVATEVTHQGLDLSPGVFAQRTISVDFPEHFDGPYALVVLVPGSGALASTIHVGDGDDEGPVQWVVPTSCPGGR